MRFVGSIPRVRTDAFHAIDSLVIYLRRLFLILSTSARTGAPRRAMTIGNQALEAESWDSCSACRSASDRSTPNLPHRNCLNSGSRRPPALWRTTRVSKAFSRQQRVDRVEFIAGNTLFILLHEMGHMLISEMQLPVLGREEDAADTFAALSLIKAGSHFSQRLLIQSAKGWFFSDRRDQQTRAPLLYYDEHGLNRQRAYQIVCLMVGSDPVKLKRPSPSRPSSRRPGRESCKHDYERRVMGLGRGARAPIAALPISRGQKIDVIYEEGTGAIDGFLRNRFAPCGSWRRPWPRLRETPTRGLPPSPCRRKAAKVPTSVGTTKPAPSTYAFNWHPISRNSIALTAPRAATLSQLWRGRRSTRHETWRTTEVKDNREVMGQADCECPRTGDYPGDAGGTVRGRGT